MWWARLATVTIAGRRQVRLRRGDACQARGVVRGFRNPYNSVLGLAGHCGAIAGRRLTGPAEVPRCHPSLSESIAGRRLGRLRRGEGFQARGAIRRFRKPYNCCPGLGWPRRRHCCTKTGPAEARRGFSSSVAFGSHITAVLGLAGHCNAIAGRRMGRLRRGEAFQARGKHCWTKTGPAEARRGFSSPRCHPSLSESI